MEKNYFNKAYMYIIGIFAIGIAISNIISFFNGVGFAFIATSILLFLAISNILKSDKKKRFGDLFIFIFIEIMLLIMLFFAYDFALDGNTSKYAMVMRNICAIYSIIAVAYVLFRYIREINGKNYKFVEYMLGNYVPAPRSKKVKPTKEDVKRNKELENGTLAPKPSSMPNTVVENVQPVHENNDVQDQEENDQNKEESTPTESDTTNRPYMW